ncbi:MAG: hypothetical protein WAT09_02005 [Paracoccaceae bacterium]
MHENLAIVLATVAGLIVFLSPHLRRWDLWRAMITPLASIIGSGFLVLGPILNDSYGRYAPLVMAGLCAVAWGFGAAIRANIATLAAAEPGPLRVGLEAAGDWVLAFAYIISVAYYLNLFGAFAVGLLPLEPGVLPKIVTSAVYAVILFVGWTRGFAALERMEVLSVSLKLAIILGLVAGLIGETFAKGAAGAFALGPAHLEGWPAVTLAFGLIVTVQGFETSRYLGEAYSPDLRIRSMRLAQATSTLIYMVYVGLLVLCFAPGSGPTSETAIIGMMAQVAPVLPVLLVAAALAAQFSAAVADTSGAGGLVSARSRGRLGTRQSYAVLVGAGVTLTWTTGVFGIIAYASRAFAVYYAVQCAIAALGGWRNRPAVSAGYTALAALALGMAVLGRAVE